MIQENQENEKKKKKKTTKNCSRSCRPSWMNSKFIRRRATFLDKNCRNF